MKKSLLMLGLMLVMTSCVAQKTKNMKPDRLTYFSFDHHNTMVMFGGENYQVSMEKDGRIHIIIDNRYPDEIDFYIEDTTIFDELKAIVAQYKMDKYKSDYHPEMQVFDGDSWSLYYKYDSGRSVSSGGYMAWPNNYGEAHTAIHEYFQKWRDYPAPIKTISFFQFTCKNNAGCDIDYKLERIGYGEVVMQVRDAEKDLDERLLVDESYMKQIQEFVNVYGLKDYPEYKSSNENDTQYQYHIRFSNGETLDLEGSYGSFMGGKETALFGLFSSWSPKK